MAADGIPPRVGRYELRRELGRGTMGVVYEAWDPVLGRRIALKTIAASLAGASPDPAAYELRFLSEAKAAARLSHPGIVVVHDVARDEHSGVLYMALEFLVGETLEARLDRGALPWREALRIAGRVADALHHAHAQGVIHRDVKPANIMVLASGEPKIMDFGVARVDATRLTAPGELFGTPLFMAPEQALGEAVDARTDLFSLGSVLYMALTGRPPFAASNVPGVLARIAHRDPRPPSELSPGLPPEADYLVARAMAKSPDARHPDGHALAEDVEDVLAGRAPRHRAGWTPPPSAAQTVSSASTATGGADELPLLDLGESAGGSPPPALAVPRRRRARPLLFLLLVATAGAYFVVNPSDWQFWRRAAPRIAAEARRYAERLRTPVAASTIPQPAVSDAPAPASPARAVAANATTTPTAEAPPPILESPPPASAEAAAEPVPGPVDEPTIRPDTPRPSVEPAPVPTPPVRPAPSARLVVEVEHLLARGSLEVWVDGSRVLREPLDDDARRKPLDFGRRPHGSPEALALRPGRHVIEIRVRSGEARRSARSAVDLKTDASRRLEVRVDRKGSPTLTWK